MRCDLKSIESGTLEQFRTLQSLTIIWNQFMKISHLLLILNGLKDQNMTLIDFQSNNNVHGEMDVLTILFLDTLIVSIQSIYFIAENDPVSIILIWFR
jgi:hypothetical protein